MKTSILFALVLLFITFAASASNLEIKVGCEWSKDYDNYILRYKAFDKNAAWYESDSKIYQLIFTSQTSCEDNLQKLREIENKDKLVMCGCYSSAYAPALFLGNQ